MLRVTLRLVPKTFTTTILPPSFWPAKACPYVLLALAITSSALTGLPDQQGGDTKMPLHVARSGTGPPMEPGLYAVLSNGELEKITGRPTNFVRTGSMLPYYLTMGVHARRTNSQFAGDSSFVSTGRLATFYYRVSRDSEDIRMGRVADQTVAGTVNLILTQMTIQHGRRQYEFEASGWGRRSRGISARHQFNFDAEEVEPGLFKLRPEPLPPGQYAFFLLVNGPERQNSIEWRAKGSSGGVSGGFIYDFAVVDNSPPEPAARHRWFPFRHH